MLIQLWLQDSAHAGGTSADIIRKTPKEGVSECTRETAKVFAVWTESAEKSEELKACLHYTMWCDMESSRSAKKPSFFTDSDFERNVRIPNTDTSDGEF